MDILQDIPSDELGREKCVEKVFFVSKRKDEKLAKVKRFLEKNTDQQRDLARLNIYNGKIFIPYNVIASFFFNSLKADFRLVVTDWYIDYMVKDLLELKKDKLIKLPVKRWTVKEFLLEYIESVKLSKSEEVLDLSFFAVILLEKLFNRYLPTRLLTDMEKKQHVVLMDYYHYHKSSQLYGCNFLVRLLVLFEHDFFHTRRVSNNGTESHVVITEMSKVMEYLWRAQDRYMEAINYSPPSNKLRKTRWTKSTRILRSLKPSDCNIDYDLPEENNH